MFRFLARTCVLALPLRASAFSDKNKPRNPFHLKNFSFQNMKVSLEKYFETDHESADRFYEIEAQLKKAAKRGSEIAKAEAYNDLGRLYFFESTISDAKQVWGTPVCNRYAKDSKKFFKKADNMHDAIISANGTNSAQAMMNQAIMHDPLNFEAGRNAALDWSVEECLSQYQQVAREARDASLQSQA